MTLNFIVELRTSVTYIWHFQDNICRSKKSEKQESNNSVENVFI